MALYRQYRKMVCRGLNNLDKAIGMFMKIHMIFHFLA